MSIEEVVDHVKPNVLIGLSTVPGLFSEKIVRQMGKTNERPIIFPLSNPTSSAECTAENAYTWTDGRCIFGSGSPFEPVEYNGKTLTPSQVNNMSIFPAGWVRHFAARRTFRKGLCMPQLALSNL